MDIVLGVSLAPASVQMVLLQGENADGTTVDTNEFAVTADDGSPTDSASDRVLAAILATREDAASAGLELSAVGVACTATSEAAALRDALTAHNDGKRHAGLGVSGRNRVDAIGRRRNRLRRTVMFSRRARHRDLRRGGNLGRFGRRRPSRLHRRAVEAGRRARRVANAPGRCVSGRTAMLTSPLSNRIWRRRRRSL